MSPVPANLIANDLDNIKHPICDILATRKSRKRKTDSKNEDEDKENTDNENDVSDYEVKEVKFDKKRRLRSRVTVKPVKKEISKNEVTVKPVKKDISEYESEKLSSYEKMIEAKRAERLAILKSLEIDQIKSEISEVVSTIKQKKRNTITRSYKKVSSPPPESIRRSRRLANLEVDYSEKALEKLSVKNTFQVSQDDYFESIPSEITFQDALRSMNSYENECIDDLCVQDSINDQKSILYNRNVLKNMALHDFNVCKVVPSRITSVAWCPSIENLIVAGADKYGSMGLWKIQDSTTNPHLFKVHNSNVPCMQFCSFNPVHLISASYDGTIRCGDLVKHTFNEIYESDEARCTWFDFLSPTTFLVSHSNGEVAVVDRKTKGETGEKRHACHDYTIKTVSVHPANKNVFITADNKKVVRLWDLRKLQKKPIVELQHHARTVNSAFFSPLNGNSILTTSLDDSICVLDSTKLTEDIKLKTRIKHNNFTGRWLTIFRATWLPDSDDLFAVGCMDHPRRVQIYDEDLNLYHNVINDNLTTVTSVHRFHPYKSALAAGNSSGKLFVFTDV